MKKNLLFIIFASSFLLFYHLGETSLVNWDEAWLASVSQDIAIRGDWFGGQWNGQTWFYEPPLVTWSLAVLYKIFGPSEFWLRSLNAIFGILIIIVVYNLSALITKSAKSAFISVIILLSNIEFLFRGRQINVEIPVTFFLVFTIYAALKTLSSPQRKWWLITGIFLGLAFLTKRASPILIFPALLPIILNKSLRGMYRPVRPVAISFLTVFFVVAVPWYLISYLRWGNQFINEFFLGYTLGKIRSVNPGAGTDIWFYITALRHAFKFWFPLIPFAIIWATVKSFRDRKIAVLTIFIWTFLIFLTLAPIKSSWFLLPIHPAIAIIVGLLIRTIPIFWSSRQNIAGAPEPCTDALRERPASNCVAVGGRREVSLVRGFFLPFFFIFSVSILNLYLYRRQAFPPDKWLPQKELGLTVKNLTGPDDLVVTAEYEFPALRYYSEREVRTAARQPDYEGKYWWIWDNTDIATALRHGRDIITIHRPGAEWPIDVWGYRREKLTETNGRIISRLLLQTPP